MVFKISTCGKLRDIIKIKMSVKWIWYSFNEICVYLNQRKGKIKLAGIWDYKQMTSSVYIIT